jgi:hypothetical protein
MDALSVTYGDSSPGGRALVGAPRRFPTRRMTLQRQNGGSKPPPYDGDCDAREVAKAKKKLLANGFGMIIFDRDLTVYNSTPNGSERKFMPKYGSRKKKNTVTAGHCVLF